MFPQHVTQCAPSIKRTEARSTVNTTWCQQIPWGWFYNWCDATRSSDASSQICLWFVLTACMDRWVRKTSCQKVRGYKTWEHHPPKHFLQSARSDHTMEQSAVHLMTAAVFLSFCQSAISTFVLLVMQFSPKREMMSYYQHSEMTGSSTKRLMLFTESTLSAPCVTLHSLLSSCISQTMMDIKSCFIL